MNYKRSSIVIIGAGPAGLSLSATLKMASIEHTILEKNNIPGGSLPEIHNDFEDFTFGVYENGMELVKKTIEFIDHYNISIEFGCKVVKLDVENKVVVYFKNSISISLKYDILIIASGIRFNVDQRFINKLFEKDIYYRISPSLNDFNSKTIAVIGSGDNATVAALRLARIAKKVYIVNRKNNWKSRLDLIQSVKDNKKIEVLLNTSLLDLVGDSSLKKMRLSDDKDKLNLSIEIDKLVFKIGYLPNSEFLKDKIDLDENGYIKTGNKYITSKDNIFAIGDIVSDSYKRIAIAMGHGTDLGNYLLKEYLAKSKLS